MSIGAQENSHSSSLHHVLRTSETLDLRSHLKYFWGRHNNFSADTIEIVFLESDSVVALKSFPAPAWIIGPFKIRAKKGYASLSCHFVTAGFFTVKKVENLNYYKKKAKYGSCKAQLV